MIAGEGGRGGGGIETAAGRGDCESAQGDYRGVEGLGGRFREDGAGFDAAGCDAAGVDDAVLRYVKGSGGERPYEYDFDSAHAEYFDGYFCADTQCDYCGE